MELNLQWQRKLPLKKSKFENLIYECDLPKIPVHSGIYVVGRTFGRSFEALYVGQALNLRSRIKGQLNNLGLMKNVQNAAAGNRHVLVGVFLPKPAQNRAKCLSILESALIRHYMSEGHDLFNKQGKKIKSHAVNSIGAKTLVPKRILVDIKK